MANTVTMQAPPTFGGIVTGTPSGTTYVPDSSGCVYNVPYQDITTLNKLGFDIFGANFQGLIAEGKSIPTSATGYNQLVLDIPANQKYRVTKVSVFDSNSATGNESTVYQLTTATSGGTTLVTTANGTLTSLNGTNAVVDATLSNSGTILAAGTPLFVDITTASGTASTSIDVRVYGDILSIGE